MALRTKKARWKGPYETEEGSVYRNELKQVKKEEIEALKRAVIIGAPTSILTAIAVLIIEVLQVERSRIGLTLAIRN